MTSGSLRLRLLVGAAVAILAAMILAWLSMTVLFARHIERRTATELTYDAVELLAGLRVGQDGTPVVDSPPGDPRFDMPSSGLYWQVTTPAGSVQSRSLWDESLPEPRATAAADWTTRLAEGPFGQRVFVIEREVHPPGADGPALVQLALDTDELIAARHEFGLELASFLGVLWIALLGAAWLQVRLGLRPLAAIRAELATMRRHPAMRMSDRHPREIRPLLDAINELAEAREGDLSRARRRAADLAHSLKTPLAALSAQSRRARAAGAVEAADGLDRAIASSAAAVETELARSRAAALRHAGGVRECSPHDVAEQVIGVVERTEAGARLAFEVDVEETLRLPVDHDDLTEILGALIENAARFARRRVRVAAGASDDRITLGVEDDGKGLDVDAGIALARGGRLDQSGTLHHGLGLAIARDLVEASGGTIELERAELGGLRVAMTWTSRTD
ncbi:ATP-binding protein [Dokdonella sp. MW10]|uniref:sensor histidine kinase n=1 Tax=Dokdonella sp. MW10 TaxID=2992926 RepID=UPI003F802C3F